MVLKAVNRALNNFTQQKNISRSEAVVASLKGASKQKNKTVFE